MAERHLLDLLFELQTLDRVPRSGYNLRGIPEPESVSEHIFHLSFLVWVLAGRESGLDRARCVELALVHDLAEVRFGDLPRTAAHYLPEGAKDVAERAAMVDLTLPLDAGALERFDEYQAKASPEARFVKVCDKLQIIIKALVYRTWGATSVGEFIESLATFDDDGFESIADLVAELRQREKRSQIGETTGSSGSC